MQKRDCLFEQLRNREYEEFVCAMRDYRRSSGGPRWKLERVLDE